MIKEEHKERELVDRLLLKNQASWKELYNLYAANLFTVCSRYVREKEDAKDILQNSFIKMFHSITEFEYRGIGSLRAWMSRIVINESLKHIKKYAKLDFTTELGTLADTVTDEEPDLEQIDESDLLELIATLPIGYRTVFNLYVFEEKSHKEIANLLDIAENSSASQFHRAKSLLVRKLKNHKRSAI
ncbi:MULTISPECIES: RNA polymerase sigma factor [unclassified Siphonobacter]|uniref:RNA polymerase sigma factor n=1 Tax=unclassified Siphonobacter TaxID=2635712 RepID=UPI0027829EF0|nr:MULTISPECIES: RNA polymerase sigma factor [unclassified Siphonobacter]MDQ1090586.1 RNA polymerase sigma factor (sigma-70 family) [Siphonobacter sp. SORGH_AS_1065]MDR6198052.1 RNA polymerase sigma factor (sigma-70 family) [Siphonobacter sp. SORGH_AS_0500]